MSNSAFTPSTFQATQAASPTQGGIVTTTAQTFAGKKTFDGGVALKGDTTGNPIASGYVGEELVSTVTTQTATANSATWPAQTYTLPAGVWLVSAGVKVIDAGTGGISAVAMNISFGGAFDAGGGQVIQTPGAGNTFVTNCQPAVRISNGTNQVSPYVFIAGTFQNTVDTVTSVIRAVRIA